MGQATAQGETYWRVHVEAWGTMAKCGRLGVVWVATGG
jgi:hypothetical protein